MNQRASATYWRSSWRSDEPFLGLLQRFVQDVALGDNGHYLYFHDANGKVGQLIEFDGRDEGYGE